MSDSEHFREARANHDNCSYETWNDREWRAEQARLDGTGDTLAENPYDPLAPSDAIREHHGRRGAVWFFVSFAVLGLLVLVSAVVAHLAGWAS